MQSSNPGASPLGNGAGVNGNGGGQSQAGNQAQAGQAFPSQPFQSLPQVLQIPLSTTAVPIPSLNTVLFLLMSYYILNSNCIKQFMCLLFKSFLLPLFSQFLAP